MTNAADNDHTAVDPAPALEVDSLRVTFDYPRPAVSDISLRVNRREIVALVGESGSGKTMTARAAIGLLPEHAVATGSVKVDGVEVLNASERDLNAIRGTGVAMIFQEPQTALNPAQTVGWQLRQALRTHQSISRRDARRRAVELLSLVEIPDPEQRVDYYPHQLSGGQKQRVVIALALANDPALLLADEPTTALDVSVQREILDLLLRLRGRIDAGILLITHNLGVVADIADRVVVVQLGEVVERGTVFDIFARPTQPYTRQLLAAVPKLPTVDSTDDESAGAASDSDTAEGDGPVPIVAVEHVTAVHRGGFGRKPVVALDDVSLHVDPGEVVGVVGESGSGKTTLGRSIGGLTHLSGGKILVDGHDLDAVDRAQLRSLRHTIAFVPQDPTASLDPRFTVAESIREPLDIQHIGTRAEQSTRVEELLDAVHLPRSFADRLPHELSGGQRQRVALARALSVRPKLLIADEPTSALDVSVQARVLELFAELQHELGFAALFISHDLAVVEQVSDRVYVLRNGRVVEHGSARDVLTRPRDEYTRALLDAVPYPDPQRRRESSAALA
ncbi:MULTISPECIES: dipeptide ABC transporter ATP-binding protein [unclassified Gordonia (in: high G+C Gram-positive bacteria)]|uniref:dipeptide ABC transporter ATP-binding protein n=1 Tax=unclassified Gordonia (in: high G+C Gram-positive bacteria) TaxID=2657482 RepID=UPI0007E9287C|nr:MULTISPECIES: ABC transporter ATP-binding protein [unclassified Gordonia (in: high G+C Gram-positive bacteria)]OBC00873.1 glutathione ABC transporter ATP-binding protein [Gordonia sp. 852002-50395_SCH5434458]OBC10478.1 glutathione ABC transporter ATP-binding protein [Gordonia sp. 852002-50816_SCH5313054-a]OBC17976.1 glutathione ABC transporter ATP-binding protein [Gordonia sp. 852002-50816_SCH5313054-c]